MAFCSNDLFVSFVCFVLSTSSVFSDGDGSERFPQKLFCSKDGSGFCFHVLSGHVDSMQARNVCSNIGGKLIDFRKSMLLEQVSKVLSDNAGSSEQLIALDARREDYSKMIDIQGREIEAYYGWRKAIVMERKDKWYSKYWFEYSTDSITSTQKAVCVYPSDHRCEGGIRTSDYRCLRLTKYGYNWFDARRYCVLMGGDLATINDIAETSKPFPNGDTKYWLGASTLSWQWGSFRGDVQLFSATPKWEVNYFEKESTSCAAILVKKVEKYFSTEWRAVGCSDNRNFSIICECNGSYVLPSELNSRTADYTAAIVVTLVTLAILAGVVILVYYKRKSKCRKAAGERSDKSNKIPNGYAWVKPKTRKSKSKEVLETIDYPDLVLSKSGEVYELDGEYSTIDGVGEMSRVGSPPTYTNIDLESTYVNIDNPPKSIHLPANQVNSPDQNDGEKRIPEKGCKSPIIVIPNELYDQPGLSPKKVLGRLKIFRNKFSRNLSNESADVLLTYESLSPTSYGRRTLLNLSGGPTPVEASGIYSLETMAEPSEDDYAKIVKDDEYANVCSLVS